MLLPLMATAQDVDPQAYYVDDETNAQVSSNISNAQAPLEVTFRANPTGMENYTPSYEWHFRKKTNNNDEELFVRYEEER
jgi:PKD repeat protein